jgi:hypothetical protein
VARGRRTSGIIKECGDKEPADHHDRVIVGQHFEGTRVAKQAAVVLAAAQTPTLAAAE